MGELLKTASDRGRDSISATDMNQSLMAWSLPSHTDATAEHKVLFSLPGSPEHVDCPATGWNKIERIMIGAEMLRQCLRVNRTIKHSAQCQPIHNTALNSKADDPIARNHLARRRPGESTESAALAKEAYMSTV